MDYKNSFRKGLCPMESVSTTFQSLDTVRALHQTVVSLRTALEEAKSEIQRLRSQIATQSEINEGAKYHLGEDKKNLIEDPPELGFLKDNSSKRNNNRCYDEYGETSTKLKKENEEIHHSRDIPINENFLEDETDVEEDSKEGDEEKQNNKEHLKGEQESQDEFQDQVFEEKQDCHHQQEDFQQIKLTNFDSRLPENSNLHRPSIIKPCFSHLTSRYSSRFSHHQPQHYYHHHHHHCDSNRNFHSNENSSYINCSKELQKFERRSRISFLPDVSVITRRRTISRLTEDNKETGKQNIDKSIKDSTASKIDVKIKVMSNIKVDDSNFDSSNSSFDVHHQQESSKTCSSSNSRSSSNISSNVDQQTGSKDNPEGSEANKSKQSGNGKEELLLLTRTEESIKVEQGSDGGLVITQTSKENVNIEGKSNTKSQSEDEDGDNSVFMDEKQSTTTPVVTTDKAENEGKQLVPVEETAKKMNKEQESKEEFDDIELIFSSDENRDPIQEDLVSISEYDPWQAAGGSGTPVLVKFSSLPTDQESQNQEETKTKNAKIPVSTTCDVFFESDGNTSQEKDTENTPGESFDSNQYPVDTKSSSLDKENSLEQKDFSSPMSRDESLDYFDNSRDPGLNRKWTNYNVIVETDISKCGIVEETTFEMLRRNTCPNPPTYRPNPFRDACVARHIPSRLASRYCRRIQYDRAPNNAIAPPTSDGSSLKDETSGPKKTSAVQTEITALPDFWKSESQLASGQYHVSGQCTLPSKFVPIIKTGCNKHSLRISERTQEARRVLLSDINFTSMVPELSRSADHLCQDEGHRVQTKQNSRYYKGNLLKTPDYIQKGITPSPSMTSAGVSQWTVNESSFGTQTIQTGESWDKRGDSFDSCHSYSTGSRISELDKHHRSRSVPSFRCAVCKQSHGGQIIRTSESMHYTPRVTFQEPPSKVRGSLPDLRHECVCSRRYPGGRSIFPIHGDSSGSTESLLDEADVFIRKSLDGGTVLVEDVTVAKRPNLRRMSETDIQKDYVPSKQSLPFLPKTAKCLKPGHLAKVISKNGRVVVGRVKYVGPLVVSGKTGEPAADDLFVGVQLQSKCGDNDGTYEGRKLFECEPLQGLFVPFKKVVMAWTG